MAGPRWLPEIIRARPSRPLGASYLVPAAAELSDPVGEMAEALGSCGVRVWHRRQLTWELILPWRTMVYGVIPRDVDEQVTVDLIQAVSEVMGLDIEIQLGPWDEVHQYLQEKRLDVVLGMYPSPERDRYADFSSPLMIATHAIFVRENSPIHSLRDLRGKVPCKGA